MKEVCPRRPVPGGERTFLRIYTRLGCSGRPPRFVVDYHPYVDLTHTIRVREDTAYVRISDILETAPLLILEAAAAILLGRLYRRRPPADLLHAYRHFSYARSTRQHMSKLRRTRARKFKHAPQDRRYHLQALFDRLNETYFNGQLRQPKLGWSKRVWRSQLGCFDPALDQIVMNRRLDRPEVPEYVVAYVLYHEMLHVKHPIRVVRCRRESHSAKFRLEEKKFADYGKAVRFLKLRPN